MLVAHSGDVKTRVSTWSRAAVRASAVQDPAAAFQNVRVAGLRLGCPALTGEGPGQFVAGEKCLGMVFTKELQAQGEQAAVVGFGLGPLPLPGGDPGQFVPDGECLWALGAEHPQTIGKDRCEGVAGLVEPVLVGHGPGQFVACRQRPGIVAVHTPTLSRRTVR